MTAAPSDDAVDVLLAGPVFFDLILSDLDAEPRPGTEVQARTLATSPGGIATLAVANARLGLSTALAAAVGDDVYGRWLWEMLGRVEGVDLSRSRRLGTWPTPVTVSVASGGDRSMVTRQEPDAVTADELIGKRLDARAALADLGSMAPGTEQQAAWWQRAARAGTQVFADIGWDSTGRWDPADLDPLTDCYAFTPNEAEAMAYTRTDSATAAARVLAERVPFVVVTRGADGAVAIDSARGEEVDVPAVPARARDATGAGDVFAAALVLGTLRDWPLEQRLAFASLSAAIAVEEAGGAVAAPGWGDIAAWWRRTRSGDDDLRARYGFLDDILPHETARTRADGAFPFARFHGNAGPDDPGAPEKGTS